VRVSFVGYFYLDYSAQLCKALVEYAAVQMIIFEGMRAIVPTGWRFPDVTRVRELYRPLLGQRVDLAWINPWPWKRDPRGIISILQAARTIRAHRPDLVHLHEQPDWRQYLLLRFLRHYPWVVTVHDPRPHMGEEASKSNWEMRLLQKIRREASGLVVHSETLRQQLLADDCTIIPERIHVVPMGEHGMYSTVASEALPAEEMHTLLFFGRIYPYKGLDVLLRAEPLIAERFPDVHIVVAGEAQDFGPYRSAMVHPERFELHLGFVPREHVASLFARASVVVLPYLEATQSAVAAIAMSAGKPVVATNVGGLSDLLTHGVTGLLTPPGDATALAEAICKLLGNQELRIKMGQAAKSYANNHLSWNKIAVSTLDVYETAIRARQQSRKA